MHPRLKASAAVVHKARTDSAFRSRLHADPKGTLAAASLHAAPGAKVHVHQETANSVHFVLPKKPANAAAHAAHPEHVMAFACTCLVC